MNLRLLPIFLLLAVPLNAHNGAVALGVPVDGITIDGDLSDWPQGMRRYEIEAYGFNDAPENRADYRGWFRVGYSQNQNALFVAVEVEDESVVTGNSLSNWDRFDGVEIYVVDNASSAIPGQYSVVGNLVDYFAPADSSQSLNALRHNAGGHIYEWRFDADTLPNSPRLLPGMVLGFDIAVKDRDADGSFSWVPWGPGGLKLLNFSALGDLLLTAGEETGTLQAYGDSSVATSWTKVSIQRTGTPWILTLGPNPDGLLRTELPPGDYDLTRGSFLPAEQQTAPFSITSGAAVDVTAPSQSFLQFQTVRTALGPGRSRVAGYGHRESAGQGEFDHLFQNLRNGDGLPDATVVDIYQAADGALWFATLNGVSRYDGQEFLSYTGADGLCGYSISAITQSSDGRMWFACGGFFGWRESGGLSVFDGSTFSTYTVEDGLLTSAVDGLVTGPEGGVWLFSNPRLQRSLESGPSLRLQRVHGDSIDSYDLGFSPTTLHRHNDEILVGGPGIAIRLRVNGQGQVVADGGGPFEAITVDSESAIWLAKDSGIYRFADGVMQLVLEPSEPPLSMAVDGRDRVWVGTQNGLYRIDGDHVDQLTENDGLVHPQVGALLADADGDLWYGTGGFASAGNGAGRYIADELRSFTVADGLKTDEVMSLGNDAEGRLWAGTWDGVSILEGDRFRDLPGLTSNTWEILLARDSAMWVGTSQSGLHRCVAEVCEELGTATTTRLFEDATGDIWASTSTSLSPTLRVSNDAVTRYPERIHLVSNQGNAIWFADEIPADAPATARSLREFPATLALLDTSNTRLFIGVRVSPFVYEDRRGHIWAHNFSPGLVEASGDTAQLLGADEGLLHARVMDVHEDEDGKLWFSAFGGGVFVYDGLVFQRFNDADGLVGNSVQEIHSTGDGFLWIATEEGITRLRQRQTPPGIRITGVTTDRFLGDIDQVDMTSDQAEIEFAFQGASFRTSPGRLVYVYRLVGDHEDWRVTREKQVRYADLPTGIYNFEVKAVDRELSYSSPATIRIDVTPPYGRFALQGGFALSLVGLVLASVYGVRRKREQRRAEQALVKELEEELQEARRMQMGLMPTSAPAISGLTVAGECRPANHVGGDLFQYFIAEDRISIAMADVTGHRMEAAIPVVMFSGILDNQMEQPRPLSDLFHSLNRSLCRSLADHKFICFTMAEIEGKALRLASCGNPYPLHFHNGEVNELKVDGYPLGVREGTQYNAIEAQLQAGDYLVLYSDGIPESINVAEEMFGYERTIETVKAACAEGISSQDLVERLMSKAREFAGEEPQADDMTCVVVRFDLEHS